MPYEVFLALRYLRSRHKRRLARVTALAAISGIGLGVAALIVVLALANGFRDEMLTRILQGTAHLSILRADGQPIGDEVALVNRIRGIEGVVNAGATTYDGAMATGPRGSAYAVLRGIDPESGLVSIPQTWLREGAMPTMPQGSRDSQQEIPRVVVGNELAKRIGLSVGDIMQVLPAAFAVNGQGKSHRLQVVGIFSSGLFEYDSTWIYLPLSTVSTFVGGNHVAAVISVDVKDPEQVGRIAEKVRQDLGSEYTTVDWQQANQPLFTALALERRMGLFIIGLIVAVGALNITTMLILVVVERRRDIAILRALGATSRGVMLLFVIEGAVVGALGAFVGVGIGLLACFLGNYFKLVSLPADVYSINNVPLTAHISEVSLAALVAVLLSVAATLYPARAAAHFKPVDTLRDSG